MGKISREQAEKEVASWLEKKKTFEETKDTFKAHIEVMTEAIMNGILVLNPDTFEFTHQLLFPLGEQEGITELKYRPRLNDKLIQPYMKGVKADDSDGRVNALIAALTTQNKGIIAGLDTNDKRIATAIGVFFM